MCREDDGLRHNPQPGKSHRFVTIEQAGIKKTDWNEEDRYHPIDFRCYFITNLIECTIRNVEKPVLLGESPWWLRDNLSSCQVTLTWRMQEKTIQSAIRGAL